MAPNIHQQERAQPNSPEWRKDVYPRPRSSSSSVLKPRQPRCRRVPAEPSGGHNSQKSESEQVTMATRFPNSETTP